MKRVLAMIVIVLLLVSTLILPSFAAPRFLDVESAYWGNSYIDFAASNGMINGYPTGDGRYVFRPENSVTKEEAMAMLYRALKSSGKLTSTEDFTTAHLKVLEGNHISEWAYPYVAYGLESGILEEKELASFVAGEAQGIPAPREQIAIWTAKAMGNRLTPVYHLTYSDFSSISSKALPFVDLLYRHGIMRGDDTGKFYPQAGVKRVEFAAICNRIFDGFKNSSFDLDKEQFSLSGTVVSVDAVRSQIRMMSADGTAKTFFINPKSQIVIDGKIAYNGLAGIPAGTNGILAYGAFCDQESLDQPGDSMQVQFQTGLTVLSATVSRQIPLDSVHTILYLKNSAGDQIAYLMLDTTNVLGTVSDNATVRFLADGIKLLEIK